MLHYTNTVALWPSDQNSGVEYDMCITQVVRERYKYTACTAALSSRCFVPGDNWESCQEWKEKDSKFTWLCSWRKRRGQIRSGDEKKKQKNYLNLICMFSPCIGTTI